MKMQLESGYGYNPKVGHGRFQSSSGSELIFQFVYQLN